MRLIGDAEWQSEAFKVKWVRVECVREHLLLLLSGTRLNLANVSELQLSIKSPQGRSAQDAVALEFTQKSSMGFSLSGILSPAGTLTENVKIFKQSPQVQQRGNIWFLSAKTSPAVRHHSVWRAEARMHCFSPFWTHFYEPTRKNEFIKTFNYYADLLGCLNLDNMAQLRF